MKKALSLILALTLCMALAVPAFAAATPASEHPDYTKYCNFSKEPIGWRTVVDRNDGTKEYLLVPDGTVVTVKPDYAFSGILADDEGQGPDRLYADLKWEGLGKLNGYIYPRSLFDHPEGKATDLEDNFWFDMFDSGFNPDPNKASDEAIVEFNVVNESHLSFFFGDAAQPETPASSGFTDVAASAYYADAVKWAVDSGVTKGTSETTFSPDADLTRAQAVTFLWRAKGSPKAANASNPFADVKQGEYYYDAVLWAVEQGITNGVSATEFGVGGNVTRGQMVTFLWRTEGKPNDNGGAWYESAENWANAQNLLTGTAQAYSTNGVCPRADVVFYLWRDLAK